MFVLSSVPGLLFAAYVVLLALAARYEQTGGRMLPDDGAGYAVLGVFFASLIMLLELLAFGLGVIGAFQRRRKRLLAFLGTTCSVLLLAWIGLEVGFADVVAVVMGPSEPPEVHPPAPKGE